MSLLIGRSHKSEQEHELPLQLPKEQECHMQRLKVRSVSNVEKIRRKLDLVESDSQSGGTARQKPSKLQWQKVSQEGGRKEDTQPQQAVTQDELKEQVPKSKKTCYWSELVDLQGFPAGSVRAYWAKQHRSIVINAKCAQLDTESRTRPQKEEYFTHENVSPLTQQTRWDEEKNLHRLKRIIPVPKSVCAKDLECLLDTERGVFIVCARRSKTATQAHTKTLDVDKDCVQAGREQELHQRCQPTKALVKSIISAVAHTTTKSQEDKPAASEEWQQLSKRIVGDSELQAASQIVRQLLKDLKRVSFPGLLQSPRFVRDKKTGQWSLHLQLRLRGASFRPEDVVVRPDEKKRSVLVEAKSDVREALTSRVVEIRSELPLPDVVDLSKLKWNFLPQEGVLRIELPLIREKMVDLLKQHLLAQPKK